MKAITFPTNPVIGQQFVPTNGATYIWNGIYWSSITAIEDGSAAFIEDGGDSLFVYNPAIDVIVDGGMADGSLG